MKIRTGRRNRRNLYLQLGPEPDDDDPCLGLIIEPAAASVIADVLNRYGEVRTEPSVYSGPQRAYRAMLGAKDCPEHEAG